VASTLVFQSLINCTLILPPSNGVLVSDAPFPQGLGEVPQAKPAAMAARILSTLCVPGVASRHVHQRAQYLVSSTSRRAENPPHPPNFQCPHNVRSQPVRPGRNNFIVGIEDRHVAEV
jgi:hypothetical protein